MRQLLVVAVLLCGGCLSVTVKGAGTAGSTNGAIDIGRRILDDCFELGRRVDFRRRRVDFGRRHDHRRSHDRRAVPAWIVRSGCGVAWG